MPTPAPDDPPAPRDGVADGIPEMPPEELAARRQQPHPPVVLDVREPWEHQIAHIAGARLVPLGSLGAALSTLDPSAEYVVYCHHGVRSLSAVHYLHRLGYHHARSLAGGIDAWSCEVDPTVPRY
jgi:adenylyltransferase/sulfurtransferase